MTKHLSVKAVATVKLTVVGFFKNIGLSQGIDGISDLFCGNALLLEPVSSEFDPSMLHIPFSYYPLFVGIYNSNKKVLSMYIS